MLDITGMGWVRGEWPGVITGMGWMRAEWAGVERVSYRMGSAWLGSYCATFIAHIFPTVDTVQINIIS